jgi:hypothetical protein
MFPLSSRCKFVFGVVRALSLGATVMALGACATTVSLSRTAPVETAAADTVPIQRVRLSDADAEFVVARAIAEHEMRQP